MKYILMASTILALTATNAQAASLCKVSSLTDTMFTKNGPLKRCDLGNTVYFQVAHKELSPATVAATHCNFEHQIMTDTVVGNPITHLVCKYQWKPTVHVQTQPLP